MGVIRACGSDPGEEQGEGDKGHSLAQTRHPHTEPAWLCQQQQSRYLSKRVRAWVLHYLVPSTQDQFC